MLQIHSFKYIPEQFVLLINYRFVVVRVLSPSLLSYFKIARHYYLATADVNGFCEFNVDLMHCLILNIELFHYNDLITIISILAF